MRLPQLFSKPPQAGLDTLSYMCLAGHGTEQGVAIADDYEKCREHRGLTARPDTRLDACGVPSFSALSFSSCVRLYHLDELIPRSRGWSVVRGAPWHRQIRAPHDPENRNDDYFGQEVNNFDPYRRCAGYCFLSAWVRHQCIAMPQRMI